MATYKRCPLCGEWFVPGGGKGSVRGRPRKECPDCQKKVFAAFNKSRMNKSKQTIHPPEIRAMMAAAYRLSREPKAEASRVENRGHIPCGHAPRKIAVGE